MYFIAKKRAPISFKVVNSQNRKIFQANSDLNRNYIRSVSKIDQFNINLNNSNLMKQSIQYFDRWATQNQKFVDNQESRSQIKQLTNLYFFSSIIRSNADKITCQNSAIDDDVMYNFFLALSEDVNLQDYLRRIIRTISQILLLKIDFEIHQLRALFILLYIPQLYESSLSDIFKSIIKLISKFSLNTRGTLIKWLQSLPNLLFLVLNGCHGSISSTLAHIPKGKEWIASIIPYTDVISILFEANKNCTKKLPNYSFQNIEIDSRINCRRVSIFPFVLSFPSRLKAARFRVRDTQAASKMTNVLAGKSGYLEINIHRDRYYEETKNQLFQKSSYDFLKKLKVKFIGEVAIDAGGPQRELLFLIVNHIIENSLELVNNSFFWFKHCDTSDLFFLGLIIGLAISNEITLPIKFPIVLYSKLIYDDFQPTLQDLAEFDPIVANSLEKINEMTMKNEDVSSLELTFDANIDCGKTVPLLDSMSGVAVTNENSKEFINEYINWVINRRYSEEFNAFKNGFIKSCPQNYLKFITSSEFDKIVSGRDVYNWKELRNSAIYNDNLTENSQRIEWFWDVFENDMTESMKRRFLRFTTGIDRPPFSGLKAIKIKFNDGGSFDKLPVSFTCFNMFFLPDYQSREQLKEKLILALQYSEGFGII